MENRSPTNAILQKCEGKMERKRMPVNKNQRQIGEMAMEMVQRISFSLYSVSTYSLIERWVKTYLMVVFDVNSNRRV